MGGVSELLRFGIPGWLLVVYVGGFLVIRLAAEILLTGAPLDVSQLVGTHKDDIAAVTIFAAAAGVPIGYVVYQLYWWVTEHGGPFVRLIPFDRGAAVLQSVSVPFEELVHRRFEGPVPAKYGPILLGFLHWVAQSELPRADTILQLQDNRNFARFVWNFLLAKNDAELVRLEAEKLSDTYHSLGAARVAISLALLFYLLIEGLTQVWTAHHTLALVVNVLLWMIFFRIFSTAREDTLMSLVHYKHDFITFYWPRTDLKPPPESD